MKPLKDEADWTPEDCHHVAYRLGHYWAREELKAGKHPDAIRAGVYLAQVIAGWEPSPDLDAAKWRGIEDSLAGKPLDPELAGQDCSE